MIAEIKQPIILIIQNRKVILASCQPVAFKWWWIGVERKIFLLKNFLEKTCKITELASRTKIGANNGKSKVLWVKKLIKTIAMPTEKEPVLPSKNLAG